MNRMSHLRAPASLLAVLAAAAVIGLAAPAGAQAPPTSAPSKTGEQSPDAKWSTKQPAGTSARMSNQGQEQQSSPSVTGNVEGRTSGSGQSAGGQSTSSSR